MRLEVKQKVLLCNYFKMLSLKKDENERERLRIDITPWKNREDFAIWQGMEEMFNDGFSPRGVQAVYKNQLSKEDSELFTKLIIEESNYSHEEIVSIKEDLYKDAQGQCAEIHGYDTNLREYIEDLHVKYAPALDSEVNMTIEEIFAEEEEEQKYSWFSEGLDTLFDGIITGEMYGMVCASGAGKSTYLMQQAATTLKEGKKVCYVFTEMKKKDVYKKLLGAYLSTNPRKLTKDTDFQKDDINNFYDLLELHRIPPQDLISSDALECVLRDTDAGLVILDYLKPQTDGEAFTESKSVLKYLSNIKTICEDFHKAFLFAVQASQDRFTLQDRLDAAQKTSSCRRTQESCDGYICIAKINEEDDLDISPREGVVSQPYDSQNIRSINIVKNRGIRANDKSYEGYFIYEGYNHSSVSTQTLTIKKANYNDKVIKLEEVPMTLNKGTILPLNKDRFLTSQDDEAIKKAKAKVKAKAEAQFLT